MGQARDVSDAEALPALRGHCGDEHHAWGDPCESLDIIVGKGKRERQPSEDGPRVTASDERAQ